MSSQQTYACSVPLQRVEDRKHRLLVQSVCYAVAAILFLLTVLTYPQWDWFRAAAMVLGVAFTVGSIMLFWVWWDVRNDG